MPLSELSLSEIGMTSFCNSSGVDFEFTCTLVFSLLTNFGVQDLAEVFKSLNGYTVDFYFESGLEVTAGVLFSLL